MGVAQTNGTKRCCFAGGATDPVAWRPPGMARRTLADQHCSSSDHHRMTAIVSYMRQVWHKVFLKGFTPSDYPQHSE